MRTAHQAQYPQNTNPALLREREVSREYGFSRPWLRRRRLLHLPPTFIRIGQSVYYARRDLEAFVEEHTVKLPGGAQ